MAVIKIDICSVINGHWISYGIFVYFVFNVIMPALLFNNHFMCVHCVRDTIIYGYCIIYSVTAGFWVLNIFQSHTVEELHSTPYSPGALAKKSCQPWKKCRKLKFSGKLLGCPLNTTVKSPQKSQRRKIFSCDQAALWMVQSVRLSVRPSVRPSVCLSVCHTFFTMFPSSYHHEIFRSYYQWEKWRPCKRSRSEVKGQGHRGQHPTGSFPDCNSSLNSHMMMKWCI